MEEASPVPKKTKPRLRLAVNVPRRAVDSFNASDTTFTHGDLHIDQSGVYKSALTPELSPQPNHLIRSLDDIELLDTLGRGSSSIVRKALHKPTGMFVAIKEMSVFDKDKRRQLLKELTTLYESSCDQLVTFFGAFYKEGSIYIALELMPFGSLRDVLLQQSGGIPEFVLAALTKQVLQALLYLHKTKHMVHRDIKPSNIVLTENGRAKLTDFGVSTALQDSVAMAHTFVGTYTYMSPERIVGADYSYQSDIWSLGICVLECALGHYPYSNNGVYFDLMQDIVTGDVPVIPVSNYSESIRSFVGKCLRKDPESRSTTTDLLSHPFVDVDDNVIARAGEWIVRKMARGS